MGFVKEDWMEAEARGWGAIDKVVCPRCVQDSVLKKAIRSQASAGRCDYCGRRGVVAEVEVLQEAVYEAVWTYFHEPTDAGVPWDGGFIIEPLFIGDVLEELGFEAHDDLLSDIIDADMGNGWVSAADGHWASAHEHEVMLGSWASFCAIVKHKTRFNFSSLQPSSNALDEEIEPARMLEVLGDRLRPHIRKIDRGTLVYRVRVRASGESWRPSASSLGAPPPESARAGRMNPAGIPYLYTAFDKRTALLETGVTPSTKGVPFMAKYELRRAIRVVDLTRISIPPSVFDLERKGDREKLLFARGFVRAISQPVKKNGAEHIEYVPSQVVCEYLAQVFRPTKRTALDGIIFPSSVSRGGRNLVVFPSVRGMTQSFRDVEFVDAVRVKKI